MEPSPRDKRKKLELCELPEWPRLMSAPYAGAHLGFHEYTFRAGVGTDRPAPTGPNRCASVGASRGTSSRSTGR